MRILIYPKIKGVTNIILIPSRARHQKPLYVRGIDAAALKQAVRDGVDKVMGRTPEENPG